MPIDWTLYDNNLSKDVHMLKRRLVLVIVAALSVFVTSAAAAMAHEFTSKPAKQTITGTNKGNHVFETGSGTVTCEKATAKGTTKEEKAPEVLVVVLYASCTAFGQPAEIKAAEYSFNAEGTVKVEAVITIKVPNLFCTLTVEPQGPLKAVTYTSGTNVITTKANVEGIKSKGEGLCGGESSTGKYKGLEEVKGESGTIGWL
jgi:hypothetical protein